MATIPQVIDYGSRPSLRSSRVDVPGQGELAVADAIARAASTFGQVMVERKEKQDRFNYSMAKQEFLTADLAQREALKDDRDYESFDEKYRTGLGADRDRITEKYQLTPHDRAIFDAEADLIRERGAAGVGEFRRKIEIDDKLAKLDSSLAMAREKIMLADPMTRNDILLTTLDSITALEDELLLTDEQAEAKRQEFVQDVALASLTAMDPIEREKVLEASLAHRKAGGALSAEDIRADKGTGSIADFLHTDTAAKLLKATKKENEFDNTQRDAYAASDSAWEQFPELEQNAEREKRIVELTKDNPDARKDGLAANRLRQNAAIQTEALEHQAIMDDLEAMIDAGETFSGLPTGPRSKLTEGELKRLREYSQTSAENRGFADDNDWDAMQTWAAMTPSERANADLDGFMPTDPTKPGQDQTKWKMVLTRKRMEFMQQQQTADQRGIAAGGSEPGLTQTQMLENYLISTPFFDAKPTAGSSKEEKDRWSRVFTAYDQAVINEGIEGKLTPTRRREIMAEVMRFEVFVAEDWAVDKKFPLAAISDEQVKRSYIPLDEPLGPNKQTAYTTMITIPATATGPGFTGSAYQWLLTTGKSLDRNNEFPDEELLEQAYFYLVTDGPDAAIRQLSSPEEY